MKDVKDDGLYVLKFTNGLDIKLSGAALKRSYLSNPSYSVLIDSYQQVDAVMYDIKHKGKLFQTVLAESPQCAFDQIIDELMDHGISDIGQLDIKAHA